MRSTSRAGALAARRRAQRGVSLVESLVAAALLGLTVVGGMTAWDTAILSGRQAVHQAWARCIARVEMEAVLNAPWDAGGKTYRAPSPAVSVSVGKVANEPELQQGTVTATGSSAKGGGYRLTAIKAQPLSGAAPID